MDVTIIKPFARRLKGKEQEVVDMYYDQQHTMLYISQYFKCSTDVLRTFFKNNNLKIRNLQESRKLVGRHRAPSDAKYGDFKFTHKNLIGKDDEIRKMYIDDEYSAMEISSMFKVNAGTINTWLLRNNIPTRNFKEARNTVRYYEQQRLSLQYKFEPDVVKNMIDKYAEGYGAKYIAKEMGIDKCVIERVLSENGVKLRNAQESHTDMTQKLFVNTIFEKFGGWKGRHEIQVAKSIEKYGVENPMQVEEFFNKQQKAAKLYKNTIIEGVEIVYQGYELLGIYRLLSEGYSIHDICIGKGKVPNFLYFFDGKRRRYYPDIFIPKDNRIIEIKSKWTYERFLDQNLAKKECVEKAGYLFDFYIMEK